MNSKAKDFLGKKKLYVSVSIVSDEEIKKLSNKYRKKDFPTDVLSFDINQEQEDGTYYLGDVVVNKEQAQRQCKEYGNSVEQEISDLVGHGVLHLLGIDHEDPEVSKDEK
ncbi:MAG: rRNA maturation RNase YbeY [Patescibacteria group bacterium]|nr:rRNA maturation RNase YbeY [Patescibacteria group bacterium]MBU1953287.1 rRNA maturation RNase YbeY [Patescibacteria group bacterium]